jgi:uncharacterized protein (TIGR00255 family)
MPLNSMTGFARADGAVDGAQWYWEIRAVNGKALDMRCRLPSGFDGLEVEARKRLAGIVRRGNCQLALHVARDRAADELKINHAVLDQIVALMSDLGGKIEAAPARLDGLLGIRGVLELEEPQESDDERQVLEAAVLISLDEALSALGAMRRAEGQKLELFLQGQVSRIEELIIAARDCPARSAEAIRAWLGDQVARLIDTTTALDPDRLHQEAIMLAAKADIQEELDRLFAHVEAVRELLKSSEPAGRKLDFLTQEFNREANTLCSKANDHSLTAIGLDLKAVVDQMREQVQNIE